MEDRVLIVYSTGGGGLIWMMQLDWILDFYGRWRPMSVEGLLLPILLI